MALVGSVLCAVSSNASVYYVTTKGSDSSGNGSQSKPWKTIGKAANSVKPGDTVNVGAGTFQENVTLSISGTASQPITFQGTRDSKGKWLTIIDPSIDASSGWASASEIGKGVYKKKFGFEVGAVICDGKNMEGPWRDIIEKSWGYFKQPANILRGSFGGYSNVPFWEGIEAMWGYRPSNGYTYIRFKNYDNPNGKDLRVSIGPKYKNSTQYSAIRLRNVAYNTIRDFHVSGARCGIGLGATKGSEVSHCIVEDNFVEHGYNQIALNPEAPRTTVKNVVRYNVVTPNRYGFSDLGPWGSSEPKTWPRYNAYWFNKMQYGQTDCANQIVSNNSGSGNAFYGNLLTNGFDGFNLTGESIENGTLASGTIIADNRLYNLCMTAFNHNRGHTETQVGGNDIRNAHYGVRLQNLNENHSSTWTLYFYDNSIWQPPGMGSGIFIHGSTSSDQFHPVIWVYHNSHSGGGRSVSVSTEIQKRGGLPNVRFLNNLFSSDRGIVSTLGSVSPMNWSNGIGIFSYNYVRNQGSTPAWWGEKNTQGKEYLWNPSKVPSSWSVLNLSVAGSLNISKTFTVQGHSYPALPNLTATY